MRSRAQKVLQNRQFNVKKIIFNHQLPLFADLGLGEKAQ